MANFIRRKCQLAHYKLNNIYYRPQWLFYAHRIFRAQMYMQNHFSAHANTKFVEPCVCLCVKKRVCVCVCVCVCVRAHTCATHLHHFCQHSLWFQGLGLTESNQQICNFCKWVIFENKFIQTAVVSAA